MKLQFISMLILSVLVIASATSVVYSKHLNRKYFVELQQLKASIDKLDTEWGQLQLEQSAWSDNGRIEKIAKQKLKMKLPGLNDVVYLQP